MKRSDYFRISFPITAWALVPAILLAGCTSPLDSLSCHYQPVRGTVLFTKVEGDFAELAFYPDAEQDLAWFRKYDIKPDNLKMLVHNNEQAPTLATRYKAIINILTSGSCSPYIVYQGDPVPTQ
ncbi:hypothetical protein [Endozoicomonas sp. 4G]|uniref:hypothetical protein n=1 Tax=Endozoicomonas sp. 4G TaxID=2872754 RepID=UPI00207870F7|nr:hypothetical protein [Endozoicomonas sp. 4G]